MMSCEERWRNSVCLSLCFLQTASKQRRSCNQGQHIPRIHKGKKAFPFPYFTETKPRNRKPYAKGGRC